MIKIIAQIQIKTELGYKSIGNNVPADSWSQLGLMVEIINNSILPRLMQKDLDNPEYRSELFGSLEVRFKDDDFYIAFYDSLLDDFWQDYCEKKYGSKGFVWDEETPMLRFSKLNFEHILKKWLLVIKNKPEYLIITEDDNNWIDLQGKDELTIEEISLIEEYKKHREQMRIAESKRIDERNRHIN